MHLLLLSACIIATCHITSIHGAGVPKLASNQNGPSELAVPLLDEPACPEIRNLCLTEQHRRLDEQQTLECVQTFLSSQIEALSDQCQHVIWQHTVAFMDDKNVVCISMIC